MAGLEGLPICVAVVSALLATFSADVISVFKFTSTPAAVPTKVLRSAAACLASTQAAFAAAKAASRFATNASRLRVIS